MRRFVRRSDLGIIIGCIFIFALFSLWNPQQWFNWGTISNIGQYTAILGLLAIGQTFVILIREIDLSVGSVYGIVGITFIGLESSNVSVLMSFIAAMLLALLIGLVNALVVIRGKVPSMIVTLGGLFFYRGLIYVTSKGAVTGTPQAGPLVRTGFHNSLVATGSGLRTGFCCSCCSPFYALRPFIRLDLETTSLPWVGTRPVQSLKVFRLTG